MFLIIVNGFYSIGQICEILNIEDFNLRYIEKTVGLTIKRNSAGERKYSQANLETLKFYLNFKKHSCT